MDTHVKRSIIQEPDPRLSEVARALELGDPLLMLVAEDLADTLGNDLGLAAPQIGAPVRVIIARIPVITVCVNPSWRPAGARRPGNERCLSVAAGGTYRVFRHIGIDAEWFALDGTPRRARLAGRDAVVFQHEVDHLEGMTIARNR